MRGVSPGLIFIPMEKIAADLRSYSSPGWPVYNVRFWHLADELPALKVRCERGADVMLAASGDNKEIFIEVMPMPCFALPLYIRRGQQMSFR